jgi:hypothetical protein
MQEPILLAAMARVRATGLAFAHPVQTILMDAPAVGARAFFRAEILK